MKTYNQYLLTNNSKNENLVTISMIIFDIQKLSKSFHKNRFASEKSKLSMTNNDFSFFYGSNHNRAKHYQWQIWMEKGEDRIAQ